MNPVSSSASACGAYSAVGETVPDTKPKVSTQGATDAAAAAEVGPWLMSFTGRDPAGRPESVESFLASNRGRATLRDLQHQCGQLVRALGMSPDHAQALDRALGAVIMHGPESHQAAFLGYGKRALTAVLQMLPVCGSPAGQATLRTLAEALLEPGANPARCFSQAVTNLRYSAPPLSRQAQAVRSELQLQALLDALEQHHGSDDLPGYALQKKMAKHLDLLMRSLGLYAGRQEERAVPDPELSPGALARFAWAAERWSDLDAVATTMARSGLNALRNAMAAKGKQWSALDMNSDEDRALVGAAWKANEHLLGPLNIGAIAAGPLRLGRQVPLHSDPCRLAPALRDALVAEGYSGPAAPEGAGP